MFSTAFQVLGYDMSWLEFVSTLAGLLAVWLNAREKIINWPIGLLNVAGAFVLFYQSQLYADMFLQIYFFVTGIYGWWLWSKRNKQTDEKEVVISFMTQRQRISWLIAVTCATIFLTYIVLHLNSWLPKYFPSSAAFPVADTLIWTMSMAGNFLLTEKKVEAWILWVLVDILAPVLYFQKNLKFVALEYIIFFGIAVYALYQWWIIAVKSKKKFKLLQ